MKRSYRQLGICQIHMTIRQLLGTWLAAAKGGRLVTRIYRWKRFITACLFTYLGCMVKKTNACATNSPGIVQSIATKKYVAPTKDRHAENVKANAQATATTRIRCHQMGSILTPQNGQSSYRIPFPRPLALKSAEQFGQTVHEVRDRLCP